MTQKLTSVGHLRDSKKVWGLLKTMPLPRTAKESLMRGIKRAASPGEQHARKALVKNVRSSLSSELGALAAEGVAHFKGSFASRSLAVAKELDAAFSDYSRPVESRPDSKKGGFLVTVMRDNDFLQLGKAFALVTDPDLVALAALYLGEAPVLSSVNLWWSPANNTAVSSQLFHFDEEDDRQLKFFLNVHDVTPAHGPFTLLPATTSANLAASFGGKHGRFSDDAIKKMAPNAEHTAFTGPAGALSAVDTSRCLHFGSRGNTKDRLVMMFQFTKASAPLGLSPEWGENIKPLLANMNDVQRRLFYYR